MKRKNLYIFKCKIKANTYVEIESHDEKLAIEHIEPALIFKYFDSLSNVKVISSTLDLTRENVNKYYYFDCSITADVNVKIIADNEETAEEKLSDIYIEELNDIEFLTFEIKHKETENID